MAWMVAAVLLLFYALGLFVFHAPSTIHLLPLVAVTVLLLDHLVVRSFRK